MYQALYRKWRPKTFDEVKGQEHVTETLKHQIASGRISHAYLFTGTRGTGKTSCAKILARAINCTNPLNGNPCNACPSCIGINNGSIMDVTEMDAASNNGVDNIRILRDEALYLPADTNMRVYIIDEVHMLTGAAFNALLKILEEPPKHLVFILATTELHKVPATILSRCQKFAFKRATPDNLSSRIAYIADNEGISLSRDACNLISRLADGSFRDAISILDQCSGSGTIDLSAVLSRMGLAENDEIYAIFCDISASLGLDAVEKLNALYYGGRDVGSVLNQLASLYRDILLVKLAPRGGTGLHSGAFAAEILNELAASTELNLLLGGLQLLQTSVYELDRNADRKIAAEICLLRLSGLTATLPHLTTADSGIAIQTASKEATLLGLSKKNTPKQHGEPNADYMTETKTEFVAETPVPKLAPPSWSLLAEHLGTKLGEPYLGFLKNPAYTDIKISDNTVHLEIKSEFLKDMLDTKEIRGTIKRTADELWGGNFTVKSNYRTGSETDSKRNINSLRRFDNIKFE